MKTLETDNVPPTQQRAPLSSLTVNCVRCRPRVVRSDYIDPNWLLLRMESGKQYEETVPIDDDDDDDASHS